jgi:serine phosphatase RsbU (regulator of sigma subunit)
MEISDALLAQQQFVRLQALLEVSRQLHSTIELNEVIHIALKIVVRELELTGAFFTTFQQSYGDVSSAFPASVDVRSTEIPDGISETSLRFPLCDKTGVPFTELIVVIPPGRILDLDEVDFLESLSMQAAVAIENARFHERALLWQRVESDLQAARQVQLSLIPQQMPEIANYCIAARSVTCYEVGGDYLDIVAMPNGEIFIVVGDVAGKGLASALVSTSFRSALRAMAQANLTLVDIATKMNMLHYSEGVESRRRYVTAILIRFDPSTHVLQILNAGHNPAFLLSSDRSLRKILASGTPIGILPIASYIQETLIFEPGTRLLVYTDGMTEVFCGDEEFGEARLLETFMNCSDPNADRTLDLLWQTLEAFSDGHLQSDDMTALVLFRNP